MQKLRKIIQLELTIIVNKNFFTDLSRNFAVYMYTVTCGGNKTKKIYSLVNILNIYIPLLQVLWRFYKNPFKNKIWPIIIKRGIYLRQGSKYKYFNVL